MINDKHIIVNYHYVQNPSPGSPGIFPCSVGEFERQVKFLSENYKIIPAIEVFEAAQAGSPDKLAAITFDDGLKGQYQNALPILEKYQAKAAFFPITSALFGRLPTAHKVHALLSSISAEEAVGLFNVYLSEFYADLREQYSIPKNRRLTDKRMHESPAAANLKETLIVLPEDIKGRFTRYAFKKLGLNEKKIAASVFMSESEVKDLADRGMTIGNHSHNHYTFDTIGQDTIKSEFNLSQPILTRVLGKAPEIFSYPHGRNNEASRQVLEAEGFKYAFTIEKRGVLKGDDPLAIPRYDTNNFI